MACNKRPAAMSVPPKTWRDHGNGYRQIDMIA